MNRPLRALVSGVVTVVLGATLAGCSGDEDADEAGARAAAQAYVDALASGDLETVEAMTGPDAFDDLTSYADDVDIRAALPDVADPIAESWLALVSRSDSSVDGPVAYDVDVSYEVGGRTGGGRIVVELDDDADPDDLDSWMVTRPLVESLLTYADTRVVPIAMIGSVEVDYTVQDGRTVWGYPGGYLLAPPEPLSDVPPVTIVIGAPSQAAPNGSGPSLVRRGEDSEG